MRILIDAHMVGERETGNETYIIHLIRALRNLREDLELIVAVAHPEAAEAAFGGYDEHCRPVVVSSSPWARLGWELTNACRREKADLLHVTYTGPLFPPCSMVNTIHDVAYKVSPEWFSPRDRAVLSVGISLTMKRCARIITVSQHAKSEIIRFLKIPSDKIDVTLEASAPQYKKLDDALLLQSDTLSRLGITSPFILAVGNLQPRKNLLRLVQAFAKTMKKSTQDCQLVLVGKAQWKESDIYTCIEENGLTDNVVFTGYVSDEDLIVLFNKTILFAYPSLYEGFGLPVIEAMACGAPVLTSNVTSIPEVAGDAAILVDPLNTDEIADGLHKILTDPDLRKALIDKGMERDKVLSWDSCARATLASYRAALPG